MSVVWFLVGLLVGAGVLLALLLLYMRGTFRSFR